MYMILPHPGLKSVMLQIIKENVWEKEIHQFQNTFC